MSNFFLLVIILLSYDEFFSSGSTLKKRFDVQISVCVTFGS